MLRQLLIGLDNFPKGLANETENVNSAHELDAQITFVGIVFFSSESHRIQIPG